MTLQESKHGIPSNIISGIKLKEPISNVKVATLIQDVNYTKQFSLKLPREIIEEIEWLAGDKIEISIHNKDLKLKKVGSKE